MESVSRREVLELTDFCISHFTHKYFSMNECRKKSIRLWSFFIHGEILQNMSTKKILHVYGVFSYTERFCKNWVPRFIFREIDHFLHRSFWLLFKSVNFDFFYEKRVLKLEHLKERYNVNLYSTLNTNYRVVLHFEHGSFLVSCLSIDWFILDSSNCATWTSN